MAVSGYVGIVAAFCTTVAFVPQIVKLRKQGGDDLSYSMLFLYLAGVLLWLVYGVQVHAVAVIWANALAGMLVLVAIVLKANPRKRKPSQGSRRLRIAVDMDEVIADSFSKHLGRYSESPGEHLTTEMAYKQGLRALISAERRAEFSVIAGAREALLELSRHHDIFITSAAMEVPASFDDKFKWLQKHFPFIPPSRIVFCGDKMIIDADILVDDRSRHFKGFRGTGILFTAPHNLGEAATLRADNWSDVLQIVLGGRRASESAVSLSRRLSMNPAES
jgi:5'(3')-deoxyribonucleotidase/uncharacterized protein with PQ loop repeat